MFSQTRGLKSLASGTLNITNPTNIYLEDGVFATHACTNPFSHNGYISGLCTDFTIPAYVIVKGIKVRIKKKKDTGSSLMSNVQLGYITSYGYIQAYGNDLGNNADCTTDNLFYTYGGETELWGEAPTPAIINSGDFGIYVIGTYDEVGTTSYFDYIDVTVYYEDLIRIDENRKRTLIAVTNDSTAEIQNLIVNPADNYLKIYAINETDTPATLNKAYLDVNRESVSLVADSTGAKPLRCKTDNYLKIDLLLT